MRRCESEIASLAEAASTAHVTVIKPCQRSTTRGRHHTETSTGWLPLKLCTPSRRSGPLSRLKPATLRPREAFGRRVRSTRPDQQERRHSDDLAETFSSLSARPRLSLPARARRESQVRHHARAHVRICLKLLLTIATRIVPVSHQR